MKRLIVLALIAVVVGVLGMSVFPRSSSALDGLPADWPPLSPTCNDVSGDGLVDLPNDILAVILHFNTKWGEDEYALVYDVTGGGVVDMPNDILSTILAFHPSGPNPDCSLVDTQVIRSAVSLLKYQDCQDAVADGYQASGVYVGNMGIHISKTANLKRTFDPDLWDPIAEEWTDLANPFGLVCSRKPGPNNGSNQYTPDKLIGPWYIVPTADTGDVYGMPPPYQSDTVPPEGFATGEDYIDYSGAGAQAGWHTHKHLCVGFNPAFLTELGPSGSHAQCKSIGGLLDIPLYGWMLHLYNFVPNPAGRFMRWNINADFPHCGYEPVNANYPNC